MCGIKDELKQIAISYNLNDKKHRKESYRKIREKKSVEQICQLKNGILLVRLKTSQNTINELIRSGKAGKARKLKSGRNLKTKNLWPPLNRNLIFARYFFFKAITPKMYGIL